MSKNHYEHRGMVVPSETIEMIHRYVYDGTPPGGFLLAVMSNNLHDACARADDDNARNLPAIVAYLYNEVPSGCWGSAQRVADWIAARAAERAAKVSA